GRRQRSLVPAREWRAEVVVDEALVRSVLALRFPELQLESVRLLGEGWDNSVWVVDERWVFRFPRREIAVPAVGRQIDLLPRLAPLLPLAIPARSFEVSGGTTSAGRSSEHRCCPVARRPTQLRATPT